MLSFSACKKDPSQLSFSLKNLTKLIDRSPEYINQVSPGEISTTQTDYLVFKLLNEIEGIDIAYILYSLENEKTTYIDIFPNQVDNLDYSKALMTLAENELGTAAEYNLEYLNANSETQTKTFDTMTELWAFVSSESLTPSDVESIIGYYTYGDCDILAGGYYYIGSTDSYFQPAIEISKTSASKAGNESIRLSMERFNRGTSFEPVK